MFSMPLGVQLKTPALLTSTSRPLPSSEDSTTLKAPLMLSLDVTSSSTKTTRPEEDLTRSWRAVEVFERALAKTTPTWEDGRLASLEARASPKPREQPVIR